MISLSPNFSVLVSPRSNRPPWKFFVCDCVLFFFLCSLREAGNLVLCGMNSNKKDERNFSLEPNYMFRIIVSWILFSITILLCAVYFCGLKIQRSLILFLSFFYFTFILFYFSFLFLFFSKWIIEPSIRKNDERNDEFSCLRKRLMQLILLRWFFFIYLFISHVHRRLFFVCLILRPVLHLPVFVSHFFLLRAVPYIYNISYKRSLACTYFQNQSNKRVFFFLFFFN